MSRPHKISMCPHCGYLYSPDRNSTVPAHVQLTPIDPQHLFADRKTFEPPPSVCPGSFDTPRNPWHDTRKLLNGASPPERIAVEQFQQRQGKK